MSVQFIIGIHSRSFKLLNCSLIEYNAPKGNEYLSGNIFSRPAFNVL